MLKLSFLAGLLLVVSPALAQTGRPGATPPGAAQADPNTKRVICETEQEIGSRLASKRVCMTADQWKEHEQQVRGQLDQLHMQTQPRGGPG